MHFAETTVHQGVNIGTSVLLSIGITIWDLWKVLPMLRSTSTPLCIPLFTVVSAKCTVSGNTREDTCLVDRLMGDAGIGADETCID